MTWECIHKDSDFGFCWIFSRKRTLNTGEAFFSTVFGKTTQNYLEIKPRKIKLFQVFIFHRSWKCTFFWYLSQSSNCSQMLWTRPLHTLELKNLTLKSNFDPEWPSMIFQWPRDILRDGSIYRYDTIKLLNRIKRQIRKLVKSEHPTECTNDCVAWWSKSLPWVQTENITSKSPSLQRLIVCVHPIQSVQQLQSTLQQATTICNSWNLRKVRFDRVRSTKGAIIRKTWYLF